MGMNPAQHQMGMMNPAMMQQMYLNQMMPINPSYNYNQMPMPMQFPPMMPPNQDYLQNYQNYFPNPEINNINAAIRNQGTPINPANPLTAVNVPVNSISEMNPMNPAHQQYIHQGDPHEVVRANFNNYEQPQQALKVESDGPHYFNTNDDAKDTTPQNSNNLGPNMQDTQNKIKEEGKNENLVKNKTETDLEKVTQESTIVNLEKPKIKRIEFDNVEEQNLKDFEALKRTMKTIPEEKIKKDIEKKEKLIAQELNEKEIMRGMIKSNKSIDDMKVNKKKLKLLVKIAKKIPKKDSKLLRTEIKWNLLEKVTNSIEILNYFFFI